MQDDLNCARYDSYYFLKVSVYMNGLFLVDSVNINLKKITDFTIKPAGLNYTLKKITKPINKPLTNLKSKAARRMLHSHGALH